jgi:hypothetical protein
MMLTDDARQALRCDGSQAGALPDADVVAETFLT